MCHKSQKTSDLWHNIYIFHEKGSNGYVYKQETLADDPFKRERK